MKENNRQKILLWLWVAACLVGAGCGSSAPSDMLLEAGDALRQGKLEEAFSQYHKVTNLYPQSEASQEAFYWIGEINRLFKKQPKEAIEVFRKAVAEGHLTSYGEKAQKRIAEIIYTDLKEYKKAIPEFQLLIDKFPRSKLCGEAQYQIGESYLALGEYEQARIEYAVVLDRYGSSDFRDNAAYRICITYFRQGNFEQARKEYENFIALYEESPLMVNARFGLATTLEELGRFQEALTVLGSIEDDYPNKEMVLRKVDSLLDKRKAGAHGTK